jgi:putative transposase
MICPYCPSGQAVKLNRTTDLGYQVYRCRVCERKFKERTGGPFYYLELPTDIMFQVVLCRLR